MTEVRGQKADVRRQKAETIEFGNWNAECGRRDREGKRLRSSEALIFYLI